MSANRELVTQVVKWLDIGISRENCIRGLPVSNDREEIVSEAERQVAARTAVAKPAQAERTEELLPQTVEEAAPVAPEPTDDSEQVSLLTEPEKESEEIRQYRLVRSEYWHRWVEKHSTAAFLPDSANKQRFASDATDADVRNFVARLHRVIGADRKPTSDTVLVCRNEKDADDIRELGFDTVAVVKGGGTIPFSTALTMLKMKYKRVILFGESPALELVHENIQPGSMYVNSEALESINEELNTSSGEYDPTKLKKLIRDYIQTDAVQACSILRSAEAVRDNVFQILSWGVEKIDSLDPRAVIKVCVDGLSRIQFLDGRFPAPLTEKSLWGIIGGFVELAYPTTVACREMLLYQMLPVIGAALGAAYYLPYGSDKHFPSLFSLAIGRTSDGKGQAKHHVEDAIRLVDPGWFTRSVHSNPASGEGLVRMLATKSVLITNNPQGKNRVVVFNSEMATTFNAAARKNSTLSGHLRSAYDMEPLENFRSESKKTVSADNYMLGFCGTITPQELREVMPAIDWKNGAANRFLWSIGFKDKKLGRSASSPDFRAWANRVRKLVELNTEQAKNGPIPINYSESGRRVWDDWYHSLPEHNDDILSESQARAAANCARVACLYAQLDERRLDGWQVQLEDRHVEAAIEIVTRSRQSVEWYLTQSSDVRNTDSTATQEDLIKLKKAVAAAHRETGLPELSQNEVTRMFSHKTSDEREELCVMSGLRSYSKTSAGGRPITMWTWQPEEKAENMAAT